MAMVMVVAALVEIIVALAMGIALIETGRIALHRLHRT